MLSFKRFILSEYLTPSEKAKVDNWKRGSTSFSDAMMDGQDRKAFEIEHPQEPSEHQKSVEDHLKPHGIEVTDYKKGVGKDKYGREVKIGRALAKTKAPESIQTRFQNDPSRQQQGSDYHVVISRHPHDVAGMTSHGQSWENESCMNFRTGSNREFLKNDVKHGTHVAYLARKDDPELERPLARIALKPYHGIDNPRDTILRPENRTYGNAPDAFSHTVNRILNKHMPGKEDENYKKNEDIYDDTRNRYIINNIDKALNGDDLYVKRAALKSPKMTEKQLDKAMHEDDPWIARDALGNPNATKKHISMGLSNDSRFVRQAAIQHPNATGEHISKALNDEDQDIRAAAAQHPNATKEQIDKALNDGYEQVKVAAIRNPNVTKEHIDKALDDKNSFVRFSAMHSPKATKEHIDKALEDPNAGVRKAAISHDDATKEHLDRALNDESQEVRLRAMEHPNITKEHIDEVMNEPLDDGALKAKAMSHPNATKDHITKGLNERRYSFVRLAAIQNPNATEEHIDKALSDTAYHVRSAATVHPNVTKDNIRRALTSPHEDVKEWAQDRFKDEFS